MKSVVDVRAENKELRSSYHRIFNSPDAETIMRDLRKQFDGTTLRKVNGVIDPNASLAAAGCREVLLYIDMMREEHATG